MISALAMPGGITYEEYLCLCLAPMPVKDKTPEASTLIPNSGHDTTEHETNQDSTLVTVDVHKVPKTSEATANTVSKNIIEVVFGVGTIANDANEEEFQDAVDDETNAASTKKAPTKSIPNIIKSSEVIQSISSIDAPENTNMSNIIVSNTDVSDTTGILKPIC